MYVVVFRLLGVHVNFFDPKTTWRGKMEVYVITRTLKGQQPTRNWCFLESVHWLKSLVCHQWKKNPCKWEKSLIAKIPAYKGTYTGRGLKSSMTRLWDQEVPDRYRTQACGNRDARDARGFPFLAPATHAIKPMTSAHWSDALTTEVLGDLGRAIQFMFDKSIVY